MKRKEFKITINAPKKKIWNVLWHFETYPKWTAPFCEGSCTETDWEEGGEVKFLSPDGSGMLSRIKKNDPHDRIYFEHQGTIKNGVEDTESEEAQKWKGMVENYTLTKKDDGTELLVETDIPETYLETFEKSWPKALHKVKELSETGKIT